MHTTIRAIFLKAVLQAVQTCISFSVERLAEMLAQALPGKQNRKLRHNPVSLQRYLRRRYPVVGVCGRKWFYSLIRKSLGKERSESNVKLKEDGHEELKG